MIGPFVEVQSGVRIGYRTQIQSHAFICEGVTIGHDCFVSHGVMFINDTFEREDRRAATGALEDDDGRRWR